MAIVKRAKAKPQPRGSREPVSYDVKRLERLTDSNGDLLGEMGPGETQEEELRLRYGPGIYLLEGRNELGRFVSGQKFKVVVSAMPEPVAQPAPAQGPSVREEEYEPESEMIDADDIREMIRDEIRAVLGEQRQARSAPPVAEPSQPQQPIGIIDPLKIMRDFAKEAMQDNLEMAREMRKQAMNPPEPPPTPPKPFDPQEAMGEIMKTKKFMRAFLNSVVGDSGKGSKRDTLELVLDHAPTIVSALEGAALNVIRAVRSEGVEDLGAQPQMIQPGREQQQQEGAGQAAGQGVTAGLSPRDELMSFLLGALIQDLPIEETRAQIHIREIRSPKLIKTVEQYVNYPVDDLLAMCIALHPPIAEVEHARRWLQSFVDSFPSDEGDDLGEGGA